MDNYWCTMCHGALVKTSDLLSCKSCQAQYRIINDIPIFAKKNDISYWDDYYTNAENAERVNEGRYLEYTPSPETPFYSQFISDSAHRVIDAGGGDGSTTAAWAKAHPEASVFVMDLSLAALNKSRMRGIDNMTQLCGAADEDFPFPNNSIDVVNAVFLVEHLTPLQLKKFFSEAHRVLKAGGHIVVASDTAFYDAVIHPLDRLVRAGKYVANDPTHINLMTPGECETCMTKKNFFSIVARRIHWFAGRHRIARALYKLLPTAFAEKFFSTMYILVGTKVRGR